MERTEFIKGMDELGEVFGKNLKVGYLETIFKRLKRIPVEIWGPAIENMVTEEPRMPPLSRILAAASTISIESTGSMPERQKCEICDGFGSVIIGVVIYAAPCPHGSRHGETIQVAPNSHESVASILHYQEKNWDRLYGEGAWEKKTQIYRELSGKGLLPQGIRI